ncbi:MAG: uroporphyrinogen-III C-methyltransferase [Pseudomonadales bacterium]
MQAASEQSSTQSTKPAPAGNTPVQDKPRGRGIALFALIVALAALAVAGMLYWRIVYEPSPLSLRMAELETSVRALDRRLAAQAAELDSVVLAERQRTEERIEDALPGSAVPDSAAGDRVPPMMGATAPAAWHLAEIRYLLRMANHRLQLERDIRGAMLLLSAADDSLARLDDPRFTPVRAYIAEERLALEALPGADVEGLFLALEAIKRDLDGIEPRAPAFEAAADPGRPIMDGTLAALWAAVSDLVRFRRLDTPAQALLLPEEALYLELNLRLMLERAQLAALRREQPIFDSSIGEARDWVERYFDSADVKVQRLSEGLAAVAPVELSAPLPDLSASLVALDAVLSAAP